MLLIIILKFIFIICFFAFFFNSVKCNKQSNLTNNNITNVVLAPIKPSLPLMLKNDPKISKRIIKSNFFNNDFKLYNKTDTNITKINLLLLKNKTLNYPSLPQRIRREIKTNQKCVAGLIFKKNIKILLY